MRGRGRCPAERSGARAGRRERRRPGRCGPGGCGGRGRGGGRHGKSMRPWATAGTNRRPRWGAKGRNVVPCRGIICRGSRGFCAARDPPRSRGGGPCAAWWRGRTADCRRPAERRQVLKRPRYPSDLAPRGHLPTRGEDIRVLGFASLWKGPTLRSHGCQRAGRAGLVKDGPPARRAAAARSAVLELRSDGALLRAVCGGHWPTPRRNRIDRRSSRHEIEGVGEGTNGQHRLTSNGCHGT